MQLVDLWAPGVFFPRLALNAIEHCTKVRSQASGVDLLPALLFVGFQVQDSHPDYWASLNKRTKRLHRLLGKTENALLFRRIADLLGEAASREVLEIVGRGD